MNAILPQLSKQPLEIMLDSKQQSTATDDVVVGQDLRRSMNELQYEPDHSLYEPIDGREIYKARTMIVHRRHADDKSN